MISYDMDILCINIVLVLIQNDSLYDKSYMNANGILRTEV